MAKTITAPTKQAILPYPELGAVANRTTFRNIGVMAHQDQYKIPLSMLKVREGTEPFNARRPMPGMTYEEYLETVLHIPELARSLELDGQQEAVRGDLTADGTTFYVTEGHRRKLAFDYMDTEQIGIRFRNDEGIMMVTVRPNPANWTELDRMKQPLTSQQRLELRSMEWAFHLLRIKKHSMSPDGDEWTNEELGDMFHKSRQWADNMIAATELDEETIAKIELGQLALTNALTEARKKKKNELKEMNEANPRNPVKLKAEDAPPPPPEETDSQPGENTETGDDKGKMKGASEEELSDTEDEFKQEPTVDQFGRPEGHPNFGLPLQGGESFKPLTYDRTSIDAQEADFNKGTNPNFKEERPKKDQLDALPAVDFKSQKTEAEMDLQEAIKMTDKINVMCDSLPNTKAMQQFRDDAQRLCTFIVSKCKNAQAIIKQAADER